MKLISFIVLGIPIPKGSWNFLGRGRVIPDNPKLEAWCQAVTLAAMQKAPREPMTGPISIVIELFFPIPKKYLNKDGSRKNPKILLWADDKADSDKCERAIWDCCTKAGIWKDDKQVARNVCEAYYHEVQYASVQICQLVQGDAKMPFEEEI